MNTDKLSFAQLNAIMDGWISEHTEISTVAKRIRARLPSERDRFQLSVEVNNIAIYFSRQADVERIEAGGDPPPR